MRFTIIETENTIEFGSLVKNIEDGMLYLVVNDTCCAASVRMMNISTACIDYVYNDLFKLNQCEEYELIASRDKLELKVIE